MADEEEFEDAYYGTDDPTDFTFSKTQVKLLSYTIGSVLETIDCPITISDRLSWGKVRIHFSAGSLDVINRQEQVDFCNGDFERYGTIAVVRGESAILRSDVTNHLSRTIEMHEKVVSIDYINETISEPANRNMPDYSVSWTQAIVFHLENSVVVVGKEAWFSEMVAVNIGKSEVGLLYDDSVNFDDDDATRPVIVTTERFHVEREPAFDSRDMPPDGFGEEPGDRK